MGPWVVIEIPKPFRKCFVPQVAAPWVPVTSPIQTLTSLPAGAPAPTFPLSTCMPSLTTHPPHGETDPDGPVGGDGASEPTDGAGASQAPPLKQRNFKKRSGLRSHEGHHGLSFSLYRLQTRPLRKVMTVSPFTPGGLPHILILSRPPEFQVR
jgi:hypothetical protein